MSERCVRVVVRVRRVRRRRLRAAPEKGNALLSVVLSRRRPALQLATHEIHKRELEFQSRLYYSATRARLEHREKGRPIGLLYVILALSLRSRKTAYQLICPVQVLTEQDIRLDKTHSRGLLDNLYLLLPHNIITLL